MMAPLRIQLSAIPSLVEALLLAALPSSEQLLTALPGIHPPAHWPQLMQRLLMQVPASDPPVMATPRPSQLQASLLNSCMSVSPTYSVYANSSHHKAGTRGNRYKERGTRR